MFLHERGYIPKAISKSRFNRRLHAIKSDLCKTLFDLLAEAFKQNNPHQSYVVDSLPVAVCDNIRIHRCRLYPPEVSVPSKRRYYYGLRVPLVSAAGEPVEFALEAGSEADVAVFKDLELELPEGSITFVDKGYTDYDHEDLLEEVGLHLKAQEELQAADAGVGGVLGQAHSPLHRNCLKSVDELVPKKDPRGNGEGL